MTPLSWPAWDRPFHPEDETPLHTPAPTKAAVQVKASSEGLSPLAGHGLAALVGAAFWALLLAAVF